MVCKPKVSMKSLCLTAASYCHTGQTKGRYHTRALFNPSRCCRGNPKKNAEMKKKSIYSKISDLRQIRELFEGFYSFHPNVQT